MVFQALLLLLLHFLLSLDVHLQFKRALLLLLLLCWLSYFVTEATERIKLSKQLHSSGEFVSAWKTVCRVKQSACSRSATWKRRSAARCPTAASELLLLQRRVGSVHTFPFSAHSFWMSQSLSSAVLRQSFLHAAVWLAPAWSECSEISGGELWGHTQWWTWLQRNWGCALGRNTTSTHSTPPSPTTPFPPLQTDQLKQSQSSWRSVEPSRRLRMSLIQIWSSTLKMFSFLKSICIVLFSVLHVLDFFHTHEMHYTCTWYFFSLFLHIIWLYLK